MFLPTKFCDATLLQAKEAAGNVHIVRAEPAKQEFLSDSNNIPVPAMLVQTKLNAMKSTDLISRVIVREIIGEAVRISWEAAENNWDAYNDAIVDEGEVWAMETTLSKAAVDKLERLKKKKRKRSSCAKC